MSSEAVSSTLLVPGSRARARTVADIAERLDEPDEEREQDLLADPELETLKEMLQDAVELSDELFEAALWAIRTLATISAAYVGIKVLISWRAELGALAHVVEMAVVALSAPFDPLHSSTTLRGNGLTQYNELLASASPPDTSMVPATVIVVAATRSPLPPFPPAPLS